MKRFGHILKLNEATQLPHSCIWFDTETTPFQLAPGETGQRLNFGWAAHQYTKGKDTWIEPNWLRFVSPEQLITWMEARTRRKTRTFVFAHNLHFESTVLNIFENMVLAGWKLIRAILESPPFILSFTKDSKTLEFLDTGNWWLHSAAQIGESVGVPKLPFPDSDVSREIWDTYCRNDVEIIRTACHYWIKFIQTYDLGGFARTLAGQSFRAFRHRFMSHQIYVDDHGRATELGREAYHGGRTECFFIGRLDHPVHCFDINSQYPFVMQENEYPTKKVAYSRSVSITEMEAWLKDFAIVADVTIQTDEPLYAYVIDHKITFPVGTFRLALTTPDIKTALGKGSIQKVHALACYEKAPIFERFVSEIYQLRLKAQEAGDEVMTYNLKILLNSLYGKFGQAGRVWQTVARTEDLSVKVWDEIDADADLLYTWRRFGGLIQRKEQDSESYNSFPAIAAHVTAYARELLWHYFQLAGRENVYYCDTDSMFVNDEGKSRLESLSHPTRLGALKHEKTFEWLRIYGAKDYHSHLERVVKGVKKNAIWLDENTVQQEEWKKLPGLLRRQQIDTPVIVDKIKHLTRNYDKGVVLESGQVIPLTLSAGG